MFSKAASTLLRNQTTRSKILKPTAGAIGAIRNLNVHEHVSMELFTENGIATPGGAVAFTPDEAEAAYKSLGSPDELVIKAQVLSGGRGLGTFKNGFKGGVHMISSPEQAKEYASQMLGQELVTKQNPKGILCNRVYLMEKMNIQNEMYLSLLMDRASGGPVMVGSPAGGTSIEDVAAESPELIFKEPIDIMDGLTDEAKLRMASNLGLEEGSEAHSKAVELMGNLYDMFLKCDCTQVEINPLAKTNDGKIVVCDAKVNFDDNAEFRNKEIHAKRDTTQEDPREVNASQYDLNYIGLDGSIGCMVNGAGLAMSTMDIIQLKGGSPANFLDVGGGATEEQVTKAFEILNADENVKAILVNIFGGIMKCDIIAGGIIAAAKKISLDKPLVVRLEGTNVAKGQELIAESGIEVVLADDLDDAAEKAVALPLLTKGKYETTKHEARSENNTKRERGISIANQPKDYEALAKMEEEKKNQELLKSPQPPRLGLSLKERRKRLQSRRRASLNNNAKGTSNTKTNHSKEQVRAGQRQFSSSVPQDKISTSNKNEKQISFDRDTMQSSSIESSRPAYRDVPSHSLMGQSIIESSILPPAATTNHSQDNTSSSRFSKEEESIKSSSSASRFSNSMQDMNQVLHPVSSLSAQELKSPTGNYHEESMKKVKTPSLFSKVMQRTPKKINPPEVQMDSSSLELQNGFLSLVNVEKAIKNSQSLTNDAKDETEDSTAKQENGSMNLCLFQTNGKKGLSIKPSLAPRRNNMFKQWSKSSKQKQSLPINNTAIPSNSSPSRNKPFASSLMYNDNNNKSQMYSSPSRKRPRPNSSPPRSGSTTQIFSSPEKSALKSSPSKNEYGTPSRLNFSKHSGHVAWDPSTTPSRKKGNLFSHSSPDRNGNPMATPQRKRNSDKLHSVHFHPKTPDTNRKTPMTPSRYYASPGGFALQRFLEGCMSPHQKHFSNKLSDENEDVRVEPSHGYDDREDSRGSVGSLEEFADGWNECWLHPPLCSDGDKNRDVGLLDWSIKSQMKFECYPKNCILGTAFHNLSDWDSISKDDLIEKRAMDMFLMKSTSDVADMNKEDITLAQWKASLMYWQHPATHPLPPQATSKRNMDVYGMDPIPPSLKRSSSITMRSNNSGESSRMNRSNSNLSFLPTASYSNLTTPFDSSLPAISKAEKAENLVDSVRGKNAPLKNGYTRLSQGSLGGLGSEVFGEEHSSSPSSLMQERKFEWQECFRSLFLQWIKEVKMMQRPCDPCSASRVSFYSIEKKSTVLFRPFIDGENFKPMILLSSSTLRFRDTLRAVGVELKVKSEAVSPESFQDFNENLLNEWVLSDIEQGEETSKVHEELEALRRVTANGGSLGAEVSISMRKRPRKAKSLSLFPPLMIEGFENCMAFYEVYLNSFDMSDEQNNSRPECDVPLLLSRGAIGQNARMTLRTLKVSKINLNSTVDGNNEEDEEGQVSTMNIHGPILPDSFRDLVYASTSYSTMHRSLTKPSPVDANENTEHEDNSLGSHYIMIQLTDHAIDKFREKSTTRQHMEVGTRGSLFFNGSSSLSMKAGENNESPNEIVQNEVTTIAVWGINRPTKLAYRSSLIEEVAPDS